MKLAFAFPIISSSFKTPSLYAASKIAEGVEYDTMAREWIAKYSLDGDKSSLVACQLALESVVEDLNEVDGLKSIQRIINEQDFEFRVIASVDAAKFKEWKDEDFFPEDMFFEMLGVIDGIYDAKARTSTILLNVEATKYDEEDDN